MNVIDNEKQYKRMTEEKIPALVTSLALPTMLSMLITVIYNTADTYFVSQINKSASAAVGVVYSIMAILQAIGFGLGMGAGSLISLNLGRKNEKQANIYASSAFSAAIVTGGIVGIGCLIFIEPLLKLLGCTNTMLPYGLSYARYILAAAPISCATFVLNNALRAEGESLLAMIGLTAGGIINVILDPVLIFGLKMGCGGAALATVISQTISFIIFIFMFLRGKTIVKIKTEYISRSGGDYGKIISVGFPTICRQGLGSVAAAALNIKAAVYGDAAVAAITIANKVYVLVRNLIIGLGQGFQPVAGFNYGAGNKKRTWHAFLFATFLGTVICVAFSIITILFSEQIMWWFCKDTSVLKIGVNTIIYGGMVMPFMAFSTFVNQLYQCLGMKIRATFLASLRQGIFFLPTVLILPHFIGCTGVEASQPIADLMTFAVSVPFAVYFYKKYIKTENLA